MAPSEVRKDEDGDKDVSRRPADVVKLLSGLKIEKASRKDNAEPEPLAADEDEGDKSLKLRKDAALT